MKFIVDPIINAHSHIREGAPMGDLITFAHLGGVSTLLPMPNTKAPLTTAGLVTAYINHAKSLVRGGMGMDFIPTGMLTESTTMDMLAEFAAAKIKDLKVYPRGRTTNSSHGVESYHHLLPLVQRCGELGIRVHFHPEHPWELISNRDAEYLFVALISPFVYETKATIIWEHGTDARCIPFWREWAKTGRFLVTLTAHHLVTDEDQSFGNVRATCKPPIKTANDRKALVDLVGENKPWVLAGADDAPHPTESKHVHVGRCACGAYTAPYLMGLYAHALDGILRTRGGVKIFRNFTSRNALRLFGLQPPKERIVIEDKEFKIPRSYKAGPWEVQSFWAEETLGWTYRFK